MANQIEQREVGRPTIISPEIILKLEEAFSLGCTALEACFFAGISKSAFYELVKREPELKDRFDELKETPVLKARQTVIKNLSDVETAQWYLERKAKSEFAQRYENINVELPAPIYGGKSISTNDSN